MPEWTDPALRGALNGAGIPQLWAHQREAADRLRAGEHTVISTGTASGKSLGFLLPVLTSVLAGRDAPTGRGAMTTSPCASIMSMATWVRAKPSRM